MKLNKSQRNTYPDQGQQCLVVETDSADGPKLKRSLSDLIRHVSSDRPLSQDDFAPSQQD